MFSGVYGFKGKTRAGWHLSQFCLLPILANFGCGRIGRTCFNQNFTDRHVRHKIYRVNSSQIFPYAACSCLSALQQRVIFGPLDEQFSLGLLTSVLLAPLAIEEDYVAEAISSNCCQ